MNRSKLIRQAASLPKGSSERREILAALSGKTATTSATENALAKFWNYHFHKSTPFAGQNRKDDIVSALKRLSAAAGDEARYVKSRVDEQSGVLSYETLAQELETVVRYMAQYEGYRQHQGEED